MSVQKVTPLLSNKAEQSRALIAAHLCLPGTRIVPFKPNIRAIIRHNDLEVRGASLRTYLIFTKMAQITDLFFNY